MLTKPKSAVSASDVGLSAVDAAEKNWEKRLNIRTTGRDGFKADEKHHAYEPTPYACLERLLDSGLIGSENVLLDYGSGKGRVPLFFADQAGCSRPDLLFQSIS